VEVTSVESIQVEVVVEGGGGGGGGGGVGVGVGVGVTSLQHLCPVEAKKPSFNSRDSTLMYC